MRSQKIDISLETTPLEIWTNSTMGSGDSVALKLLSEKEEWLGTLELRFTAPPRFQPLPCMNHYEDLDMSACPSSVPSRVWRISLIRSTEQLMITTHCNGEELANFEATGIKCGSSVWNAYWSRSMVKIEFWESDSATDFYRKYIGKQQFINIYY